VTRKVHPRGDIKLADELVPVAKNVNIALRILKGVGPFLISQSHTLSEAFARHKLLISSVEVVKESALKQAENISCIEKKLLEKYIDADESEKFRIKTDLHNINKEMRLLNVCRLAVGYLHEPEPEKEVKSLGDQDTVDDNGISLHWMDKFSELAKSHNEEWRQNLLARALAKEAESPNSISIRALWLIGTLDEVSFQAFSTILNLCTKIDSQPMVPSCSGTNLLQIDVPDCILGENIHIGNLTFLLNDSGLIGDLMSSQRNIEADMEYEFAYGNNKYNITSKKKFKMQGIIFTRIGRCIAKLYDTQISDVGLKIFNDYINSLDKKTCSIEKL
jgi:hypothetical protein